MSNTNDPNIPNIPKNPNTPNSHTRSDDTYDINELEERMKTQEIANEDVRKLLVARYSILHLYSDLNIENMLPTIEQIRAANSNPDQLEAVEQKFVIFLNFLRKKAESLTNEEEQKELIFPAEDVLSWLIKKIGGQPIYY